MPPPPKLRMSLFTIFTWYMYIVFYIYNLVSILIIINSCIHHHLITVYHSISILNNSSIKQVVVYISCSEPLGVWRVRILLTYVFLNAKLRRFLRKNGKYGELNSSAMYMRSAPAISRCLDGIERSEVASWCGSLEAARKLTLTVLSMFKFKEVTLLSSQPLGHTYNKRQILANKIQIRIYEGISHNIGTYWMKREVM